LHGLPIAVVVEKMVDKMKTEKRNGKGKVRAYQTAR